MNQKSSMLAERELLKKKPTVKRWELEIERILGGERESEVVEAGGVEEYVDKSIMRSADSRLAKTCFTRALARTVRSWQPSEHESKEYVFCLLELIGAKTPNGAPTKLLSFFNSGGSFNDLESQGGYGANADLDEMALSALENYFPAHPYHKSKEEVRNYADYTALLHSLLGDPRRAPQAAVSLIQTGELKLDSPHISALFEHNPQSVATFVSLVFDPARKARFRSDVRRLVEHAHRAGGDAVRTFKRVVGAYGARLEVSDRRASVVTADGDRIPVEMEGHEHALVPFQSSPPADDTTRPSRVIRINDLPDYIESEMIPHLAGIRNNDEARKRVSRTLDVCISRFGRQGAKQVQLALNRRGADLLVDSDVSIKHGAYTFRPQLSNRARLICQAEVRWEYETPHKTELMERLQKKDKEARIKSDRKGKSSAAWN